MEKSTPKKKKSQHVVSHLAAPVENTLNRAVSMGAAQCGTTHCNFVGTSVVLP